MGVGCANKEANLCFVFYAQAIEYEYQKLTKEASLFSFIANAFLLQPSDAELSDSVSEEIDYHPWSAYINQLNTFLYMVYTLSILISLKMT